MIETSGITKRLLQKLNYVVRDSVVPTKKNNLEYSRYNAYSLSSEKCVCLLVYAHCFDTVVCERTQREL